MEKQRDRDAVIGERGRMREREGGRERLEREEEKE